MKTLEKLNQTTSRKEFAKLLGYKPKTLAYILYKIPADEKYTEFSIPKKNGDSRKIKAPVEQLKKLQKHLATLLNNCYEEITAENSHNKSLAHGFRKNHSIITNASKHKNRRYVFNVDLKDFFPSINFGRIRGFFIKNAHFKLDPQVATVIAQIACDGDELPQGSPCSPVISNLIGHLLDIRMVRLAKSAKCTYSRYADDLTFSTNKKVFPEIIARKNENDNSWVASDVLKKEIDSVWFKLNENKTSMQYKLSRQITTGLIVNKKVNIKREYYKLARAMCHSLFLKDEFYIKSNTIEINKSTEEKENTAQNFTDGTDKFIKGNINQLEGILSHIYNIKRDHDNRDSKKKKHNPSTIMDIYRKFLFYKHFFSLTKPLIICEGKTDIIYLKCALRQLYTQYSELVEKKENRLNFKISFFNHSKTQKEVLAMPKGTSGLASLMDIYSNYIRTFKGNGQKYPVIILVDNDSGSEPIKKKLKIKSTSLPFYHFEENLYVVFVSSTDGQEVEIEDLFDESVLKIEINGKKFNRSPQMNNNKEYSKTIFAKKVVKANQDKINFENFKTIFNNFKNILDDYNKKIQIVD